MLKNILKLILQIWWRKQIARYHQFLKYCVGGGLAFFVDIAGLYIFTEFCGLWYILSATLSFILAAVFNYLFQRFITFKSQDKNYTKQFILFIIIALVGLLINNSILYILVEFFGLWYMFAKAFVASVVLIWNFWANKKFTFKEL